MGIRLAACEVKKSDTIHFHACLRGRNLRRLHLRSRAIKEADILPTYTTHRALQDAITIRSFGELVGNGG